MCITSGEYAHGKSISDKILIGYAPITTYNNDRQPTKRNKHQRVRDDVRFVHVYTTTSAKGSLRPGTKAGILLYLARKILDRHAS